MALAALAAVSPGLDAQDARAGEGADGAGSAAARAAASGEAREAPGDAGSAAGPFAPPGDLPERLAPSPVSAATAAAGSPPSPADPRRPDRRGGAWARWAERAAGLATLLAADRAVRRSAQDFRRRSPDASVQADLATLGNDIGTWQKSVPFLVGGALGGGALLDGSRGLGRGASLLGGVLAGSMASEALNRMVGRGRPVWGEGAYSLDPFSGHASFPSGHAAYLFSVAGGVDAVTDGWLPAAAAYGAAGISAYGRLYADKHWLSDVVVGAVVGATVSRMATRRAMRLLGVADDDGSARGGGSDARPGSDAPGDAGAGRRDPEVSLLATPSRLGVRIRF